MSETANKAVLFCGHISFGYTGLAKIGGKKADHWLAEHLLSAGPSAQSALERVKNEATRAFRSESPEWKRHAFVGVGWSRSRPILSVISNFTDVSGQSFSPRDEFVLNTVALDGVPVKIVPAGQPMAAELSAVLRRQAKQVAERGGPGAMADLLVRCIQRVAKSNAMVGDDVTVAVIPRSAVPVHESVMPSAVSNGEAAFYYVPSLDDNTPRFYQPMSACGGIAVGGGETWIGEKPPWWKD